MPVDIVEMLTADEGVALETLTALYAPERPLRFTSAARPFYRFRSMQAGELHASRFSCNLSMRHLAEPDPARQRLTTAPAARTSARTAGDGKAR